MSDRETPKARNEAIVQQLYATGLSLQMCLEGSSTDAQRQRLEKAIDTLDGLIEELAGHPPKRDPDD